MGIWIEATGNAISDTITPEHPLMPISTHLPAESFKVGRIQCEVRVNPLPLQQLIEGSKHCSQKLFQFYLLLDGTRRESYWASLRTRNGKTVSQLQCNWPHKVRVTIEGVAKVQDMLPAWSSYVEDVAERRKEMGMID